MPFGQLDLQLTLRFNKYVFIIYENIIVALKIVNAGSTFLVPS